MDFQDVLNRLRKRSRVPLFVGEVWDADLAHHLRNVEPEALFRGQEIREPRMAAAALAGLHLWNDDFQASHNLCQGIRTETGSYWHGLCHRREGHRGEGLERNLANARYWFRQTGRHLAFDIVYRSALGVLDNVGTGFRWATEAAAGLRARGEWDPNTLIDWFAQADAGTLSPQTEDVLQEIQWREIDLLTDWCIQQAVAAGEPAPPLEAIDSGKELLPPA